MPGKSDNAWLKLSGLSRPGEAIRAVILGHLNLDSNTDTIIEFQWYKKECDQQRKEEHQQQTDSEHREELNDDEYEIPGASAPIYLVRKDDVGCRIGVLAILRSNSSRDFVDEDEKKKKQSRKMLAKFKSEMVDIVHMESDDVDEECYGDYVRGERTKMSWSWRKLQKSKTSSTGAAAAALNTTHKHHHEKGGKSSSSLSSSVPNVFEISTRSGGDDGKISTGKSVVKEEQRQIDDSTTVGAERSKKAKSAAFSSTKVHEERLFANAGYLKHKYGGLGHYVDDEHNEDESMNDYLLFGEKEEYEKTKTKMTTSQNSEDDKIYVNILRKLKAYARLRIRHMGHFLKILKFATFCVLYFTMLYLQTDPILSFEVTSTVRDMLKPRIKSTHDLKYFYEWLSESVVEPIWSEAPCGDGVCSAPYEFPAFGRFGCKADCGSATNTISFVIHIQSRFGNSIALSALELMSQASWNLCLQDP